MLESGKNDKNIQSAKDCCISICMVSTVKNPGMISPDCFNRGSKSCHCGAVGSGVGCGQRQWLAASEYYQPAVTRGSGINRLHDGCLSPLHAGQMPVPSVWPAACWGQRHTAARVSVLPQRTKDTSPEGVCAGEDTVIIESCSCWVVLCWTAPNQPNPCDRRFLSAVRKPNSVVWNSIPLLADTAWMFSYWLFPFFFLELWSDYHAVLCPFRLHTYSHITFNFTASLYSTRACF